MTRTCMDCPAPISRDSKGRCRSCAMKEVSKRPGLIAARNAKTHAMRSDPEFAARHRASCLAAAARVMSDPEKAETTLTACEILLSLVEREIPEPPPEIALVKRLLAQAAADDLGVGAGMRALATIRGAGE
jgi:hypothetical protein